MLLGVEGSTYRQCAVFPNDAALLKALFLATEQATVKWTIPIQNCDLTANSILCLRGACLSNHGRFYLQKFFRTPAERFFFDFQQDFAIRHFLNAVM